MASDYPAVGCMIQLFSAGVKVLAGAAAIAVPLGIINYNKTENIITISQGTNSPIIKTSERFRSDRVYIPVQDSSGKPEYIEMKKYLRSLEVLDKTKRVEEETRLKKILENNN